MERKELGWIESAEVGFCGCQECGFGVRFDFRGKGWGCGADLWSWSWSLVKRSEHAQWAEADRDRGILDACKRLDEVLKQAGKRFSSELKGTPVECVFDGGALKSWRVYTEVIQNSGENR